MTAIPAPLLSPEFMSKLEQLELVSRKMLVGRFKGDRLSKRKGSSVEFADHRHYAMGDDLRFLDWNLYARLDRLFIKLFLEEEDLNLHLLVDQSLSMDFGAPTKLHYAKQVAAALGFVGLINLDRVGVYSFGGDLENKLAGMRGRGSTWRMMRFLEELPPAQGAGNLGRALKTFSLRAPRRGITVIISDFMDKQGFEEPLRYLLARQMDIYAVHVLAPEEIDPEIVGDLRLIDVEDQDVAEVTVSAALVKRYRQNLGAFRGALQQFCAARGIAYLFASTQEPFERLILNYLRKRGLLR
jgi:uncharacterized protein (DUF58 family)